MCIKPIIYLLEMLSIIDADVTKFSYCTMQVQLSPWSNDFAAMWAYIERVKPLRFGGLDIIVRHFQYICKINVVITLQLIILFVPATMISDPFMSIIGPEKSAIKDGQQHKDKQSKQKKTPSVSN